MNIIILFIFLFLLYFCCNYFYRKIKIKNINYAVFYICGFFLLVSCSSTKTIKKEYIKYTPAVYETKEKVKTDIAKRNGYIAKRNGYEILEGTNRVISVLGNDSYIIENSYEGTVKISGFHNPDVVDDSTLCSMFVKRNGNFSYNTAIGGYKTVKNYNVVNCIDSILPKPKLIKKEQYEKKETAVEYYNKNCWLCKVKGNEPLFLISAIYTLGVVPVVMTVHDIVVTPQYVPYRSEYDKLPTSIDDLLCDYSNKKEKCRSLKDVCKQYPEICRKGDYKYEWYEGKCYKYFNDSNRECELIYDDKGCENCSF